MPTPIYSNLAGSGGRINVNEAGGTLGTPLIYKYEPISGHNAHINRMIVHIADGGNLDGGTYGDIPVLTNGLLIGVFDTATDELDTDLTNGVPIRKNSDWSKLCYDMRIDNVGGIADSYITARWTFTLDGQMLTVSTNQYFGVHARDNMAGLSAHYFSVRGKSIRKVS